MARVVDLDFLPSGDREILAQALHDDPAQRFPSCTALIQALDAMTVVAAPEQAEVVPGTLPLVLPFECLLGKPMPPENEIPQPAEVVAQLLAAIAGQVTQETSENVRFWQQPDGAWEYRCPIQLHTRLVRCKLEGFRQVGILVGLPGRFSFETAPGSAVLIPKGSRLRINIHYAPTKTPETDLTEVGLFLAQGPVARQWRDLHCRLTNMQIPANDANYQIEGTNKVKAPITVYQVGAHMHLRGKAYRIDAELPDGKRIELLNVGKFSFNWQLMYVLAEPVHLPAGTVIHYLATYDNSAANPLVMQYDTPNRLVTHGERTVDEMMGGFVMHTVDSEQLNLSALTAAAR